MVVKPEFQLRFRSNICSIFLLQSRRIHVIILSNIHSLFCIVITITEGIMEIRTEELSLQEKLHILSDAAKYDVACTSSGSDRRGKKGYLGNAAPDGICHSFASDGRCISLLKILLSNECIFDCKYCLNRSSNDRVRATFTPEEICTLVVEFYRRNYIEGLFLSSGIVKSPAYTMELIYRTLYLLRTQYRFNGYVHVKAIPGAPEELIANVGYLADRMSVNMELSTIDGLKKLAPHKNPHQLIRPIRQIQNGIADHRLAIGKDARMERSASNRHLNSSIFKDAGRSQKLRSGETAHTSGLLRTAADLDTPPTPSQVASGSSVPASQSQAAPGSAVPVSQSQAAPGSAVPASRSRVCSGTDIVYRQPPDILRPSPADPAAPFVPAGQSTQMIIGAAAENDLQLLTTTQKLYQQFDLKRVFFSAYIPLNEDTLLPAPDTPPPLLREHRLYQADWLLRFYGFHAEELLSKERPNFNILLDPKCDWALRHLELFPVEINTASYAVLLRVPGIGIKSADRIVKARRLGRLEFGHLKKMGVVLKRAVYFITCGGKMMYRIPIEEDYITRQLACSNQRKNWEISHPESYRQLSLFDDFHIQSDTTVEDTHKALFGQL